MNQRLLSIMRSIYRRHTGQEVAEAIKQIRQEIEQEKEKQHAKEELLRSQQRFDELHHNGQDAYGVAGVSVSQSSVTRTKLAAVADHNGHKESS